MKIKEESLLKGRRKVKKLLFEPSILMHDDYVLSYQDARLGARSIVEVNI